MIPPFDENGYLPPGVHPATLEEVAERFGTGSDDRVTLTEELRHTVSVARRIGIKRFIINGSFVTDKMDPGDVDCVALAEGLSSVSKEDEADLVGGMPHISVQLVPEDAFLDFVERFFATDRMMVPKGMIELVW